MKKSITNAFLVLASVLGTLIACEIGVRIYNNENGLYNFIEQRRDLINSAYPAEFDRLLGWVPKEGSHPKNVWNTKVSVSNGVRSNGNVESLAYGKTILAVGDSFTFGDEVSDNETWPAILEQLSDARVINGGVFGYGIDQSYLRMKNLIAKFDPDHVIFSFIPQDIYRNELSERSSVPKPYFDVSETGDLLLRIDHIPSDFSRAFYGAKIFRKTLGYSFLAHQIAMSIDPEYWLQGNWRQTRIHSNGPEVACRIFEKLSETAKSDLRKYTVLVQYGKDGFEEDLGKVDEVIACIDKDSIEIVDLRRQLIEIKKDNVKAYNNLYRVHMTKAGNEFVATQLLNLTMRK